MATSYKEKLIHPYRTVTLFTIAPVFIYLFNTYLFRMRTKSTRPRRTIVAVMFYLRCLLLTLYCIATGDGKMTALPLYALDYSEHCKRRDALPSVFLSRRVMEGNSHVLHFSKLEIPYSCFASIRTEAGYSILMMINLPVEEFDKQVCQDGYELAIYEFTETFGGYWGPMPEELFEHNTKKPVYTKQYTLQPRPRTEPKTTETTTTITEFTKITTTTRSITQRTAETESFINIEVPLVNFSVNLVPSENNSGELDEFREHLFDEMIDGVPRPGQQYDTSILPLVHIAVKEQDRPLGGSAPPRYQLDYDLGTFTLDHRLNIPQWPKKTTKNRNRNRWKKKKIGLNKHVHPKNNYLLHAIPSRPDNYFKKEYTLPTTGHQATYEPVNTQVPTEINHETTADEYATPLDIDDVIKKLNKTGKLKKQSETTPSDVLSKLDMSGNAYDNMSVYLAPFPTYTFLPVSAVPVSNNEEQFQYDIPSDGGSESSISKSLQDERVEYTPSRPKLDYNASSHSPQEQAETVDDLEAETDNINPSDKGIESTSPSPHHELNVTTSLQLSIKASTYDNASSTPSTVIHKEIRNTSTVPVTTTIGGVAGPVVDHESWENVVQAAPVMAGLLNQHEPEVGNSSHVNASARHKRDAGSKRNMAAIDIEDARPHRRLTTRRPFTTWSFYRPSDAQEFAHLLELQDDDMTNHVTLKMNSTGPTMLYNICETYDQLSSRYLAVFNSSRIMLSIENFKMSHVMVVLTMAKTVSSDERCPDQTVECQVQGHRICIDKSNACDRIPNCGSLNAYDEDRLLCGSLSFQGNVALAAMAFLAVIATLMVMTHYWLTKCVPKVANAFFVYSDTDENVMHLKPIMRSPGDGDAHSLLSDSAYLEGRDMYFDGRRTTSHVMKGMFSFFSRVNIFKRRRSHEILDAHAGSLSNQMPRDTYSFPELEIRNLIGVATVDRQVQTGESLEMKYLKKINSLNKKTAPPKFIHKRQRSVLILPPSLDQKTESLDKRSDAPSISKRENIVEEQEILNTVYETNNSKSLKLDSVKNFPKPLEDHSVKNLRFKEQAMYMSSDDDAGEENIVEKLSALSKQKHSISGLPVKHRRQHQKAGDIKAQRSDFRNFFKKKKDHK